MVVARGWTGVAASEPECTEKECMLIGEVTVLGAALAAAAEGVPTADAGSDEAEASEPSLRGELDSFSAAASDISV